MECAVIINVGPKQHEYQHGPLGSFIVPGKSEEGFGMLVVPASAEIQDVGGKVSRRRDAIPAAKLAVDILGEKGVRQGMLICSAEPDLPRSLEKAMEDQKAYLDANPGELRNRIDPIKKLRMFWHAFEPEVKEKMLELSGRVAEEWKKFNATCRKLVTQKEVEKAQANRMEYCKRLVVEGDQLYASGHHKEINEHRREAAAEIGYEAPWAFTPVVKDDCPACGVKCKRGVAICGSCGAVLDDAAAKKYKVGPYAPNLQAVKTA